MIKKQLFIYIIISSLFLVKSTCFAQYAGGKGDGGAYVVKQVIITKQGAILQPDPVKGVEYPCILVSAGQKVDNRISNRWLNIIDLSGKSFLLNCPEVWSHELLPQGIYIMKSQQGDPIGRLLVMP